MNQAHGKRRKRPRKARDRRFILEQRITRHAQELLAGIAKPSAVQRALAEGAAVVLADRDRLLNLAARDPKADYGDRLADRQRLALAYLRQLGVTPPPEQGPSLADVLRAGAGNGDGQGKAAGPPENSAPEPAQGQEP